MRFRITVRGEKTELRGYIDGDEGTIRELAAAMKPFGVVVVSIADPNYNPFQEKESNGSR